MWHNGRTDLVPIVKWEGGGRTGNGFWSRLLHIMGAKKDLQDLPHIYLIPYIIYIIHITNIMSLLYPSNTILQWPQWPDSGEKWWVLWKRLRPCLAVTSDGMASISSNQLSDSRFKILDSRLWWVLWWCPRLNLAVTLDGRASINV